MADCCGSFLSSRAIWAMLSLANWVALSRFMLLGANTLDQLAERALAASSELMVVAPSSDDGQVDGFAVEGRPQLEESFELGRPASFGGGGPLLVFVDLFLDLRVGDFRGAFVEQAWAGHGDSALGVDFDEFPYEGWAFH